MGPTMFRPHGFQNEMHTILYTGNCRVSVNDLRAFQPLYLENGSLKRLTALYADTLYCTDLVKELPLRAHVEQRLLAAISRELDINSQARFEIWTPCEFLKQNHYE